MRNRKENGITLIALTVTIVVMLIIAGVSLLDGQDSSIGQAKDVKTATEYKEAKDSVRMAIQEALLASDKGMLERDIFEKYLDKHINNGAYEITNFSQYDDSERGQYTVVVYRDQEKKKKIDTFGIDTSGNFTN